MKKAAPQCLSRRRRRTEGGSDLAKKVEDKGVRNHLRKRMDEIYLEGRMGAHPAEILFLKDEGS